MNCKPEGIVIYTRVSTHEQADSGKSLDNQLQRAYDYANYLKVPVVANYREGGISGKKIDNRPGLLEMLANLKPRQMVVVLSLSRLARNAKDFFDIQQRINDKYCFLHILDLQVDTNTPSGNMMLTLMSAFAQFEREEISKRTSSVLNFLSREGKLGKKPPYGWRFAGKQMPFERVEEEQVIIEEIRSFLQQNPDASISEIVKSLTEGKYKPRKKATWKEGDPEPKWDYGKVKAIVDQNDLRPTKSLKEEE